MMATTRGQPDLSAGMATAEAEAAARAWPPQAKQATTRTRNARVLMAEVASCVPLPHLIPRHCRMKKPVMTRTAISFTWPSRDGMSAPLYSAMTIATAAAVPQVESQSLQPTMKPAKSPRARREKLYCPPLRGMAAPNSAMDEAPARAYRPPITQTPKNRKTLGSHCAMSPGARTIPAAMVLPTAAEMPNHMPRTLRRRPRLGAGGAAFSPDNCTDASPEGAADAL